MCSCNKYLPKHLLPKKSSLWQILNKHYEAFERSYRKKFESQYGFFRPVIGEVVRFYLKSDHLKEGFARVRCPNRAHEFLLQFSCKVRCFCPSCQAKRKGVKKGSSLLLTYLFNFIFQ
ncbi:transposase zinc-binding domain-containing protein [bacterium]|nr:transposase zinc-binding domain-containing protein [bacterium]